MKRISRVFRRYDVNRFRTYFQLAAFGVFIYGGYLAIDMGNSVPTFACPYAGMSGGTCYLLPLQHQISLPAEQLLTGRGYNLLVGLVTFFLFFILFNKAWCGFACPLGTIQDWITKLREQLRIRYSNYSSGTFNRLKNIKYIVLALLLLIPFFMNNSLFGAPKLSHDFGTPYCMTCPGRTVLPLFSGDASQLAIDFSSRTKMVLTTLGMSVTGLFLGGAFFKKRFFCLFCPMSALHYIFSKAALLRLSKDGQKCTRCGNCSQVCDVGITQIADDVTHRNIVQDDCLMCFKCVAACPEEECLKVIFAGITVYEASEEGFFLRMNRRGANGAERE